MQRLQAEHTAKAQRISNFQRGGTDKLTGADDPRHAFQQNGDLADLWYVDDGDTLCQRTWTQPHLSGKLMTRGSWPLSPLQPLEAPHSESLWDPTIADQLLAQADVRCARANPALSGPADGIWFLRGSFGVSRSNHVLRVHGHTILVEKRAAEIYDEVGQRSLERLFPEFTEDSSEQATLSAGQSGRGYKRVRDIATPAYLGALIAAKPRIQAMVQDVVTAGLLPQQPLETRFAAVIETATSTYFGEDRAKRSESGKQLEDTTGPSLRTRLCENSNTPVQLPKMMTAMIWIFLRPLGRADSEHRSSKGTFHGCLTGLESGA